MQLPHPTDESRCGFPQWFSMIHNPAREQRGLYANIAWTRIYPPFLLMFCCCANHVTAISCLIDIDKNTPQKMSYKSLTHTHSWLSPSLSPTANSNWMRVQCGHLECRNITVCASFTVLWHAWVSMLCHFSKKISKGYSIDSQPPEEIAPFLFRNCQKIWKITSITHTLKKLFYFNCGET